MSDVTLDPEAIAQFQGGTEYLKVRDSEGRLVGYFLPLNPKQHEFVFGVKSPLPTRSGNLDARSPRFVRCNSFGRK